MVIIQWTALAYSYWSHKHGYLWQETDKELYVNDNKYLSSKQTKTYFCQINFPSNDFDSS